MNFRTDSERKKPLIVFSQAGLTDIVMLLLIFFLLTSSFVANMGIKVNVPKAEAGAPTNQQIMTVTVTRDGRFFLEGEQIAADAMAEFIREEVLRTGKTTLVLRADKDARVDDAVRVMNIGKALNLSILMATERASNE